MVDNQHPEQVAASVQAEKDMGIGAAKSAGQTLETVGKFATLGIGGKSDDSALDAMNEDQQAGANLETILEYVAGDEALKSLNLSDKLAHVGRIAKFMEANPRIARILGEAIRSGTVGGAVGGVHDGTEGAVKGAAMGATLGGVTAGVGELLPGAKVTYASPEPDAAATQAPGLLRQITKGENSVQPEVQSTIRGAVKSAAEDAGTATEDSLGKIASEPIVNSSNGASTILDDHIAALQRQTKAAYKAVDDAVGFDLKAERQALSNDKYKLSQLGSTDADITQRGKLIEAINDSEDRIAEAQQKLTDAGIDPRAADALHQRLQATKQLKAKLITRYNPATDTFNVDGLLKDVQTLRVANKFGDRIEQALGSKEAADKFAQQLMSLKSQGVKAVKAQKIAKYVAYAVIGTGAAKVTGLASLLGGGR